MPLDALFAVLGAALLHATWNALMKRGAGDPLINSCLVAFGGALVGPFLLLFTGLPAAASWPYVVASAIVHVPYFLIIGFAYRIADFSVIYPLMRGGAPLITAILGAFLLGENLTTIAWCGVVLVCSGIVGLSANAFHRGRLDALGLLVAVTAVAIIVAYTLIDGLGARLSGSPAAYVVANTALGGFLTVLVALAVRPADMVAAIRSHWAMGVVTSLMAMLGYGIALWAMTRMPIGVVGAVRETSVLFATVIAAVFLRERFGRARVAAAIAIVGGLIAIQSG